MDTMILTTVLAFILGFCAGSFVAHLRIKLRLVRLMLALSESKLDSVVNDPLVKEDARKLICEERDGILYFYDALTHSFICQGRTLDEANKNYLATGNRCDAQFTHNSTTLCLKGKQ